MKLIMYNKLWALVEFISPGEETLNTLVTYKIRYAFYIYETLMIRVLSCLIFSSMRASFIKKP